MRRLTCSLSRRPRCSVRGELCPSGAAPDDALYDQYDNAGMSRRTRIPRPAPALSTTSASRRISSFHTANDYRPFAACTPLAINGLDRAFIPYPADLRTDGAATASTRPSSARHRTASSSSSGGRPTSSGRDGELEVIFTEGSGTLSVIYGSNNRQRLDGDERNPVRGPGAVHPVLLAASRPSSPGCV